MYSNDTIHTITSIESLVNNLLLLLSEKEKAVITKRFSLDENRKYTLEEIGKEFSVTRERIRQIEKSALNKMKRNVFNTSLKYLHEHVADIVREHGGLIREDIVYSKLQAILPDNKEINKSCIRLSLVLDEKLDCVGNTINFYPYVKDKTLSDDVLRQAAEQLINQLASYGDVRDLPKIFEVLKQAFDSLNFDVKKLRALIEIDKRLTMLENEMVGLMGWRHIHPRTLRDKILFVLRKEKKPLHFVDIANSISQSSFDNRQVNVQAVHNELIRYSNFILIGRGIYALAEWGYEKGTVAQVIESILSQKKELEQDEIVNLVLKKRQVKKITIVLALKNNPKFERVGRKMYRLKVK